MAAGPQERTEYHNIVAWDGTADMSAPSRPDDPNKVIREELVGPGETAQGPEDGLMGAGFAEVRLTRLLR